jgi:hypothetical protein
MTSRLSHRPTLALRAAAITALALLAFAGAPAAAGASLPITLGLLNKPAAAKTVAPVAALASADPPGLVHGTMLMVHAGGWAGHDANAQQILMQSPGALLREHGWRTVSVDYDEGTGGLQDVLDAAGAELARGSGNGPLCLYGESAGAQLALIAASRLHGIDCVIGLGAPTDIIRYETEGAVDPDGRVQFVAGQMRRFFGTTATEVATWSPVAVASAIHGDVLLMREGDDAMVPESHMTAFAAASPTTQRVDLEAGDPADPSTTFVHGTISAAGRAAYAAAIVASAERAMVAHSEERVAAGMHCAKVARSVAEVGARGLRSALACLARHDVLTPRKPSRSWRHTTLHMRGVINAARVWSQLRGSNAGRYALLAAARRDATVVVSVAQASTITLRLTSH